MPTKTPVSSPQHWSPDARRRRGPGALRTLLPGILLLAGALPANAADLRVQDVAGLRRAVQAAAPGTHIRIAPGTYPGGLYLAGIRGSEGRPVVLEAADPAHPPRIAGGGSVLQLSEVAWLELRDLVLAGGSGNGLNIDDGGTFETPSHHVTLRRVRVSDIGPKGNCDGIKLSGVEDFRIEECTIERWGDGGQGVDMVGCHRGVIERCSFRQREGSGGVGVQAKGGSSEVTVRRCRFEHAGARGVNVGGSTGLQFFRPRVQGYEAKRITVEECVFVGCQAPVAVVGVDGALVHRDTFYRPGKWAVRILQETRAPGFVPCRGGVFSENIVVFRSDQWSEGGVNIGPDTAPDTFRFARNAWFCEDRPERSRPSLPTPEEGGLVGQDPLLRDPDQGDFHLRDGSPAVGRGAPAP